DRQAEAGAGLAAVRAAALIEFFKNAFEIGGLHAGALMGEENLYIGAERARVNESAGAAAIFLRIVKKIEQNLLQQIGVAFDERQIARQTRGDLRAGKDLAGALDRRPHHFGDIDI